MASQPVQRRDPVFDVAEEPDRRQQTPKCATVVGDVMVTSTRTATGALRKRSSAWRSRFALRYPSTARATGPLDGDSAAAMRYTGVSAVANQRRDAHGDRAGNGALPAELTMTARKTEPVVLPARIPNLLVNGTTGASPSAMATNIPPHNLNEVRNALINNAALDNEDYQQRAALSLGVKGPDFPTGGQILNSGDELTEIYRTAPARSDSGGTWDMGPETHDKDRTSRAFPYTVNKSQLVERIADVVIARKAAAARLTSAIVDSKTCALRSR